MPTLTIQVGLQSTLTNVVHALITVFKELNTHMARVCTSVRSYNIPQYQSVGLSVDCSANVTKFLLYTSENSI